ncbi:MAG: hypothetical protein ONB06_00965, partial [candidate division KSB1 bacterium]|nr:hypothetical protein [candidate division KSB1 bacterium]
QTDVHEVAPSSLTPPQMARRAPYAFLAIDFTLAGIRRESESTRTDAANTSERSRIFALASGRAWAMAET